MAFVLPAPPPASPRTAADWTSHGIALAQRGLLAEAIAAQQAAIGCDAGFAPAWCNIGNALLASGQHGPAQAALRHALTLQPNDATLWFNLANALLQDGHAAAAAEAYAQAARRRPDFAPAWFGRGSALSRLADHAGAQDAFATVIALRPDLAAAHLGLGNAALALGEPAAAMAAFETALAIRPDFAEAWCNIGVAQHATGAFEAAIASARRAIGLQPGYADALSNLGNALLLTGQFAPAIEAYRAAILARPGFAAAHANLGAALRDSRQMAASEQALRHALHLAPASAEAHFNLALTLLSRGAYAEGWAEHEWRWALPTMPQRGFAQPQWRGEALHGQRILLHAEQGLGDTLQFIRYAPLVAARGAHVILDVPAPLQRLLAGMPGVSAVVASGEALPAFDLHCPMMSLPHAFATRLESIPAPVAPSVAPALAQHWREKVLACAAPGALRVGLVWAGSPRPDEARAHHADRRRSLALAAFAPLAGMPGLALYSLQHGTAAGAPPPPGLALIDLMAGVADFADTAALLAPLDLVIAVDTSVAHLAATMGKPVWLLSRFDACWRWLDARDDTPWYPTMRLYRQAEPGAWAPVLARLARDLRARLGAR
jgi:tetratricopeptide (TPR) repeat protein